MEYSAPASKDSNPKLPPPSYLKLKGEQAKDHAGKCRDHIDSFAMYEHPYQIRKYCRWRRADLFKQAIQWLRRSYNSDPVISMHYAPLEFRSENDPDYIPTPVYDEFSAPINNEAARLGRPEYKPYVRPSGERPDAQTRTGAKRGQDALVSMLRDMRWPEQEELGYQNMPMYGGWWLESYWDASWDKTTRIPVSGAMRCPQCDFRLASAEISEEHAAPHIANDSLKPKVGQDKEGNETFSYEATECLTCEPRTEARVEVVDDGAGNLSPQMQETEIPAPKLEPYTPVDEELDEKDHFDRPLGEDVPLGQWKLETGSPYDYFLPNLGIDQSPAEIEEWVKIKVRSLDWIRKRYDNAYLVKAEDWRALMKYHPIAGERAIYEGVGLKGVKIFSNHARVKEYHKKPWREEIYNSAGECTGLGKMNRGRSIVMANDVMLFDGDYLMDSKTNKGVTIPRVHLDYASHEARSGGREFDGMSMAERLYDACENTNEIHSQIQDARVHKGSPKWLATRGMNLDYETSGTAGSIMLWDPDTLHQGEPREIDNTLLNSEVYTELHEDVGFISRSSALTETERGQPPTGITAALALQFLQEQSGEQRRPRIRAIREMLMRVFSHGLALCHELVREPRELWTQDARGNWSEKSWTGSDLAGQTDVQIDPEPDHDTDLQRQQRILDFVKLGLQDQRLARKVAKINHVDEELFAEENLQDETAEREFCEWMDYEQEPVVDDELDSHDAHYDRHGADAMSEKFRDLEDEAGWDLALPALSGWKDVFNDQQMPVQVDPAAQAEAAATGQPPPPPQVAKGYDTILKERGVLSLEQRIMETWKAVLTKAKFQPQPGTEQALMKVVRFRAHMAAHKLLGERAMQAAQMGQQVMAAPEAPEQTMAGTVPTAGGANSAVAA